MGELAMSDGASHGPYCPTTDADLLTDREVNDILDGFILSPFHHNRLVRHMRARERMAYQAGLAKGRHK
jgi:hypothetical protein